MSAPNGPHLLHLHAAAEEHGRAHRAHHEHHRDQAAAAYEQQQADDDRYAAEVDARWGAYRGEGT